MNRPVSSSVFNEDTLAIYSQNGQDLLWGGSDTTEIVQLDIFDEARLANEIETDDSDSDDDDVVVVDVDADVVYVKSYQRPIDISPIAHNTEALLREMEQRAKAAEEQNALIQARLLLLNERISCQVCTNDLLQWETMRMPCGHICCRQCLQTIVDNTHALDNAACPQCRGPYGSVAYCPPIIFP